MNKKKYNYFSKIIRLIILWLAREYLHIPNWQTHKSLEKLLTRILNVLQHRGPYEAIKLVKALRASVHKFLEREKYVGDDCNPFPDCKELPQCLKWLRYVESGSRYPITRLLLTILYVTRHLTLPVEPNIESITKPANLPPNLSFGKYTREFWNDLGVRHQQSVPRKVYWRKYHLSTKVGPSGGQALWNSLRDFYSIPDDLRNDIKVLGGKKLSSRMDTLQAYGHLLAPFFCIAPRAYRRLSAIQAPEGKTREVAILDYWSQTALLGLHQYLFSLLRRIPQDCTFDQGSFLEKLPMDNEVIYSIDLTTATDRFPIWLIDKVLRERFTDDYVNSWRNIMVGHPFKVSGSINEVRYAVGNPMGAYSSWNSFALTHHYVIYYCCRELGVDWRNAPYVLLGDDIAIKGDKLAKKYMEVLTQLGVEFSLGKTHTSTFMYEFAKRIIHNRVELTPFPVAAIYETLKKPTLALGVLVNECRKGWNSDKGTPGSLVELYRLLPRSRTYCAKLGKFLYISHQVMMGLQGRISAQEALEPIVRIYYPKLLHLLDGEKYRNILSSTIMQCFVASADLSGGNKPLGLIAEQLVIFITSIPDETLDYSSLILSLPVLQIHGYIEETYLRTMKEAYDIDAIYGGDWKLALRALTIPLSDQVYYSRNQDLRSYAAFKVGKTLLSSLDQLERYPNLI